MPKKEKPAEVVEETATSANTIPEIKILPLELTSTQKAREPIASRQYTDKKTGKLFSLIPKSSIINRMIEVFGEFGAGWDLFVEEPKIYHDSVTVRGNLIIEGLEMSSFTGGHAIVPGEVTTADAIMKAENACFKRCCSFLGIPVTDEEEPLGSAVTDNTQPQPETKFEMPAALGEQLQKAVLDRAAKTEAMQGIPEPSVLTEVTSVVMQPSTPDPVEENVKVEDDAPMARPISIAPKEEVVAPPAPSGPIVMTPPVYADLLEFSSEISVTNYEALTSNDTLKSYLDKYKVNKLWIANGFARLSRKRMLECLEYCKAVVLAGPIAPPTPPAPRPPVVLPEKSPMPQIIAPSGPTENLLFPVGEGTPPILGKPASSGIDIGPAPRKNFPIMNKILDVVEGKAAMKGISSSQLMMDMRWQFVDVDAMAAEITQEQFDELFAI